MEDKELIAEVREMAAAGLGAAELGSSWHGLPPEGNPPETYRWGTDFWADRVRTALLAGEARGFGFDLTLGPEWPWVSPAVAGKKIDLSQHELVYAAERLLGPSTYEGEPPRPDETDPKQRLVAVTAAQRLTDPTMLSGEEQSGTMLDPDSTINLTKKVDSDGRLHWDVPPGEWLLFGFWQQPTRQLSFSFGGGFASGKSTPRGVPAPLAVDHMRRESAQAALRYLDEHLLDRLGRARSNIHQVFEESLELSSNLLWTGDFLEEFRARRGYDLTRYLPVVFVPSQHELGFCYFTNTQVPPDDLNPIPGAQTRVGRRALCTPDYNLPGAAGERVRRDYHQTLTDLWVEEHLLPTARWARQRRMKFRSQVYGVTFDVIAAAKALDIPEVEDHWAPTYDFMRTLASGAHLSGARTVSIEHGAETSEDYMMTLAELKRRGDKAFAAGANQLIMHVHPYKRANGARWPTWTPWSSEYFFLGFADAWNATNTQWPHVRPLVDYFGRAQTVLRAGRPVTDVAVYRDIYGYGADPDLGLSADSVEPPLNVGLIRAGFSFDFVNPATLAERATSVRNRHLIVQKPGYKALLVDLDSSKRIGFVDNTRAMAAPVAQRLVSFAKAGLPIVFVGRFPERGVSYKAPEKEDKAVRTAVERLKRSPRVRLVEDETEVPAALAELGVGPDLSFEEPQNVYSIHRETNKGDYWFLWNSSNEPTRFVGSFHAGRRAPEAWELWTGEVTPIGLYRNVGERVEVPIELAPLETVVIGFKKRPGLHVTRTDAEEVVERDKLLLRSTKGGTARATLSDGTKKKVRFGALPAPVEPAEWTLHVEGAVPEGKETHDLTLTELKDWREIPELMNTSGIGTYRTTVTLGKKWVGRGKGAYLELGRVEGGVQIRVNGTLISPASVAVDRFDVGPFLRRGDNTVKVELTTTLKNRLNSMATQEGYRRFLDRPKKTQPYGLIGPVQLVPYAERVIGS